MANDKPQREVDYASPIDPDQDQDPVPMPPIGVNKPLQIRIQQIFSVPKKSKALLISSAVKSANSRDATPDALHGVRKDVRESTFVRFAATDAGSPVVYYSAACLAPTLSMQVRLSPDNFDQQRYERYADLIAQAAQLPVFAASGVFGGVGGAAGASAAIFAVKKAVKVVLGALDRWADGDESNDFISNYDLNLSTPGLVAARAGWFLMRDDDAGSELMVSPDGKWNGDAEVLGEDSSLFFVNASDGTLRYKKTKRLVDDLDQPYVLLNVSGAESKDLEGFEPSAVGAVLMGRFMQGQGDVIEDIAELLSAYNDLTMTRRVGELDKEIEGAPAGAKAALLEQRTAVLKHIKDSAVKDLIPTAPN